MHGVDGALAAIHHFAVPAKDGIAGMLISGALGVVQEMCIRDRYCPACGKKQERTPRKHKKRANGTGNISVLPGNRAKKYMARRSGELIGTYTTYAEAQKALDLSLIHISRWLRRGRIRS